VDSPLALAAGLRVVRRIKKYAPSPTAKINTGTSTAPSRHPAAKLLEALPTAREPTTPVPLEAPLPETAPEADPVRAPLPQTAAEADPV
jgi:hypothetical protein